MTLGRKNCGRSPSAKSVPRSVSPTTRTKETPLIDRGSGSRLTNERTPRRYWAAGQRYPRRAVSKKGPRGFDATHRSSVSTPAKSRRSANRCIPSKHRRRRIVKNRHRVVRSKRHSQENAHCLKLASVLPCGTPARNHIAGGDCDVIAFLSQRDGPPLV